MGAVVVGAGWNYLSETPLPRQGKIGGVTTFLEAPPRGEDPLSAVGIFGEKQTERLPDPWFQPDDSRALYPYFYRCGAWVKAHAPPLRSGGAMLSSVLAQLAEDYRKGEVDVLARRALSTLWSAIEQGTNDCFMPSNSCVGFFICI